MHLVTLLYKDFLLGELSHCYPLCYDSVYALVHCTLLKSALDFAMPLFMRIVTLLLTLLYVGMTTHFAHSMPLVTLLAHN